VGGYYWLAAISDRAGLDSFYVVRAFDRVLVVDEDV
jgi:hypothetical protein